MKLEQPINSCNLPTTDIRNVEENFPVHLFVDFPPKLSNLAKLISQKVCKRRATVIQLKFN